jgi:hypothetical protein
MPYVLKTSTHDASYNKQQPHVVKCRFLIYNVENGLTIIGIDRQNEPI